MTCPTPFTAIWQLNNCPQCGGDPREHALNDLQRLHDGIHAAVSWTYIDGERARIQARVALKQAAGWPLTDGEAERLEELGQP